jgi:hypothetical protein
MSIPNVTSPAETRPLLVTKLRSERFLARRKHPNTNTLRIVRIFSQQNRPILIGGDSVGDGWLGHSAAAPQENIECFLDTKTAILSRTRVAKPQAA